MAVPIEPPVKTQNRLIRVLAVRTNSLLVHGYPNRATSEDSEQADQSLVAAYVILQVFCCAQTNMEHFTYRMYLKR